MDQEPKARYPKQQVGAEGQEAGYIGDVEVYDPPEQAGGFSNAEVEEPASSGKTTRTNKTAADSAPDEKPIVGQTGTVSSNDTKSSAKK